jgi:hypothetical protein
MQVFIGIDPGASGYICMLAPELNQAEFISNKEQPHLIFEELNSVIEHYSVNKVMIEDVHSLPTVSAKSNFSFGFNLGLLHGIIGCNGIGLDLVQPKVWQKYIGIKTPVKVKGAPKVKASVRTRQLKLEVADVCQRLYPKIVIHGPKGGLQDGKSDSLMIAHYASHIYR